MKHLILLFILVLLFCIGCLEVESDPVTISQQFTYTASGDDGIVGQASQAEIRMSLVQSDLINNWGACVVVTTVVPPAPLMKDTLMADITVVTGVPIYFAIKTADEVPNWSEISNIVTTAYADVTAPAAILDFGL